MRVLGRWTYHHPIYGAAAFAAQERLTELDGRNRTSFCGAWRGWAAQTDAVMPGTLTLLARATDGAGEVQPMAARPNAGGYGNNSIHRVAIRVGA